MYAGKTCCLRAGATTMIMEYFGVLVRDILHPYSTHSERTEQSLEY